MTVRTTLARLLPGDTSDVVVECRRCGANVSPEMDECPECGATEFSRYEIPE